MDKLNQTTATVCPPDDVNKQHSYQELKGRLINEQNSVKQKIDLLNNYQKKVDSLNAQILEIKKAKEDIKARYDNIVQEKEQLANKLKIPLENDIKALKRENTSLKEQMAFKDQELRKEQEKYRKLTVQLQALKEQMARQTQRMKNLQAVADEKELLEIKLLESSTIRVKQKVVVQASQAELYNESKKWKFEAECLAKKLKIQEQINARRSRDQTSKIINSMIIKPGNRPTIPLAKNSKSFVEQKKLNAIDFDLDQESESDNISSFKRGHKEIFTLIDNYYLKLQPSQTTFFLNALAVYSEQRLEEKTEVSEFSDF